jgi:outer membrane protein OmpA-like peptidoglycan-associated protein
MRRKRRRIRRVLFGLGKYLLGVVLAPALVLSATTPVAGALGDVQVSVFSFPGLTEGDGSCSDEVDNLEEIISRVPGYSVDRTITTLADQPGSTLLQKLNASRFFFVPDMERSFNVSSATDFPATAVTAFQTWLSNGGVIVMTGTYGTKDVDFLNKVTGWSMTSQGGYSNAPRIDANTVGTPFGESSLNGLSLGTPSATDAIGPGNAPNFKALWGSATQAAVATMNYGSGTIIFMGWDFYNSGYNGANACPAYSDNWTQKIVPAALKYASQLSQSGLDNATTTGGDLKYSFSQNGNAYYVIIPSGATAPSNSEVKAGSNYGSVTVASQGTSAISANVERVFPVTGLTPATDYTAYLVTEYDSNGTATFSTQQVVNFSTKPGTPTVVSLTPDSGKVTAAITPFGNETNFEYSIDGGTTWVARSPASSGSPWEITGLTNGTTYNFQFRSAFKTLRSDATVAVSSTPSVAPAYLSALSTSQGTLSPTFAAGTLSYQVSVANAIESLTVTPTSAGNTITVRGEACTSGQASSAIPLAVGANQVTVSVIRAVQGAVATVYTVQVTRQAAVSSSNNFTPPPKATAPDPVPELQLLKSKNVGKSLVKLEIPKGSTGSAATKVQVRLLDVSGKLIREIEIPVSQDVKTAEFELDMQFGTFQAVVVAMNAAGSSAKTFAPGQVVNMPTTALSATSPELKLLGVKLTSPISFAADKAAVSKSSKSALAKLVTRMEERSGRFMVTGFVRSAGRTKAEEKRLATARAKEVARILKAVGATQWVQFYGFGSTGSNTKFGNSRSVEIRWIPSE